ncbi:MAG: hypothetical protein NC200_03715 [Candidatus Gastranaerophilales bacterium]|nr:hypothetical protein [Candidatus Gastranaerophilales bacterium]
MKKLLFIILFLIISLVSTSVRAATLLQTGVSVESVPNALFGSWRVEAQLDKTSNYSVFKPRSVDLWNLSRLGNVITLENPFTKAKADIQLNQVEGCVVIFSKTSSYDNKVLKDTVTIRLNGDTFEGYNDIVLETRSLYDGHVLKADKAKYLIKGKKIAGMSVVK